MATAKKLAKKSARKPAKAATRAKAPVKAAAKGAKSAKGEIVYSDVRRDALAWQLAKLR